jgi:hypothetical protein
VSESASVPHISVLALCEQDAVILKPDQLYRFEVVEGCEKCARLAGAYKE